MKNVLQGIGVIGLVITSGLSQAATGYVDDGAISIVRDGSGDCVHTQRWEVDVAIIECEPEIVAARDAVPLAAIEVAIRTEETPIHLATEALFNLDSVELSDIGKSNLSDLVAKLTAKILLEQNIQVTGYTDQLGSDAYNVVLSKKRAAAVRDYLVLQGVVPQYISINGLGSADFLVTCDGIRGAELVECLAPNRRAEVEVSGIEAIQVQENVPVR